MSDEKKKRLFPYFAYLYSKKTKPDKYGDISDFDKWHKVINDDKGFLEEITQEAMGLSDEEWTKIEQDYSKEEAPKSAKKGAKLDKIKKLQAMKKGKKCKCGCDLVTVKEKGGKVSMKCACGCAPKKQKGGTLNVRALIDDGIVGSSVGNKWERKIKAHKLKKFKK